MRAWSLLASGALAGLGGAQLAMFNYVGFTRDMTAGRGFIALGAVLLGARHPVGALLAALAVRHVRGARSGHARTVQLDSRPSSSA